MAKRIDQRKELLEAIRKSDERELQMKEYLDRANEREARAIEREANLIQLLIKAKKAPSVEMLRDPEVEQVTHDISIEFEEKKDSSRND